MGFGLGCNWVVHLKKIYTYIYIYTHICVAFSVFPGGGGGRRVVYLNPISLVDLKPCSAPSPAV